MNGCAMDNYALQGQLRKRDYMARVFTCCLRRQKYRCRPSIAVPKVSTTDHCDSVLDNQAWGQGAPQRKSKRETGFCRSQSEPSLPPILLTLTSDELPRRLALRDFEIPRTNGGSIVLHKGGGSFKLDAGGLLYGESFHKSISLDDRSLAEALARMEGTVSFSDIVNGRRKTDNITKMRRIENCEEDSSSPLLLHHGASDLSTWAILTHPAVLEDPDADRASVATGPQDGVENPVLEIEMSRIKTRKRASTKRT